jgi:uncharacterized protein YdeI (YjbR/CyaY-like superfamily)
MMMDGILFKNQEDWTIWLEEHQDQMDGIWITFDKYHLDSTLLPVQALLVSLQYGWIDGQLKRIDDQFYVKYFSPRRKHSIWSTKNKETAQQLIDSNQMMPRGLLEVNRAKEDGRWEKADQNSLDYSLIDFQTLLQEDPKVLQNYQKMSLSVQRIYASSYYSLKTLISRQNRLVIIKERLRKQLKPMDIDKE